MQQYWSHPQKAWKFVTPNELANAFEESQLGRQNAEVMSAPSERNQKGIYLLSSMIGSLYASAFFRLSTLHS